MSDIGLSTISTVLLKTGIDAKFPVGDTIKKVRRGARAVRRAGARWVKYDLANLYTFIFIQTS